jgi:large subunit ribosomal protein L24
MQKIRRNDQVTVLTGRDKGKRGEVLRVMDDGRALVSGRNIVKKHTRPDPMRGIQGVIVENEAPIQISNHALWNTQVERGDIVGFRVEDGKKVRFFKSTGKTIGS